MMRLLYWLAVIALSMTAGLTVALVRGGDWSSVSLNLLLPLGVAAIISVVLLGFWRSPAALQLSLVPAGFASALDGLKEGIVILDFAGGISFANRAFLDQSGWTLEELRGKKAKSLPWTWRDTEPQDGVPTEIPWLAAVKEGRSRCGRMIGMSSGTSRIFVMEAAPIKDPRGQALGAIVSFEDVTRLQKKQAEFASLLETVRQSAQQIRRQNENLEQLVIRDPLTGCFQRRHAMEVLEKLCQDSRRDGQPLSCILIDIDHFRVLNETHGHLAGDRVLREVARCLMNDCREHDLVCRYEGEEFLIILPQTALGEAAALAEQLRKLAARLEVVEGNGDEHVSISLGVAELSASVDSVSALLAMADTCLKRAKEAGRNQVCCAGSDIAVPESKELAAFSAVGTSIPYPAVTALISALAYRDMATAAHSRRVADLCVAVGQRLMSLSACHLLEMAALLHDIGKIGIPDATLLKSTPLTEEEWEVLRAHDRIGVEIVRTSFATPELTEIIESSSRSYEECQRQGESLPLGARILSVANAYDAMTSDQIYRQAKSPAEALAELRRCAGTQFDPEIVEQFAEILFLRGRDSVPRMEVPVEVALAFGMQLERLAEAVDRQDLEMLKALAGHLCQTARNNGAEEIGAKAQELEQAAHTGTDLLGILSCAGELLNFCRATQGAYISAVPMPPHSKTIPFSASGTLSSVG